MSRSEILSLPKRPELECALPGYLQHDLDAFTQGLEERSGFLDCLWCELYGSINGAEIDDQALIADTPYLTALQREFLKTYLNARRRELFVRGASKTGGCPECLI